MNIQVRVLSSRAQTEVAALRGQVAALQRQLAAGGAAGSAFGANVFGSERRLTRWGNQVQWAGRQLQYNFTLPLVLAGAAATKFALDNEKALTRVSKVYGDGTQSVQVLNNEIKALDKSFEALSERFGVNRAETIDIAAGWAAAGASGVALAKATEITLRTMVLGEIDAKKATEALISIQAQYGLSTKELSDVIAQLNIIENQTGISLAGLVEGFQRAAGVARSAGVDTRHLGAMLAALTPAAGSAAQAGNALKTIISRLLAPTKEAVEVLGLMGVNIGDLSWKSLNATQRLELMSKKFLALDKAQQAVVSAVIASRYQINKFDVLMRELGSTTGFYQKALNATSDRTRYLRVAQQELNKVLDSSPQKFKIIWTMLQNAMADIIQPMIPLLLSVANAVKIVVQWFSNLDPAVQKIILAFAVFIALVGPLVRYIGALGTLIGYLALAFTHLRIAVFGAAGVLGTLISMPISALASGISALGGAALIAAKGLFTAGLAAVAFARGLSFGPIIAVAHRAIYSLISLLPFLVSGFILTFRALSISVPVMMAEFSSGIARGMLYMTSGVQTGLIIFATVAGKIWRAAFLGWNAIIAVGISQITVLWRGMFTAMSGILVGGSALLGGLWRGMLSIMIASTIGFGTTIARIWMQIVGLARVVGPMLLAAFKNPWVLAVIAILAIAYTMRDKLTEIWNNVVKITRDAWNALPQAVLNAFSATIAVIQKAALAVYHWMSYLNPFARHSPSLVDEVKRGMRVIKDEFGNLKTISEPLSRARAKLKAMKDAVTAQSEVVELWKRRLDDAGRRVDALKDHLRDLQDVASKLKSTLDQANQNIQDFANTPIKGMRAMEDAIFGNEMAQKRLRLEMMKMEDAIGPLDQLQDKLNGLQGEIELLRGQQADLRAGGAGSDILSVYDQQINALMQQQNAINSQIGPLDALQRQLDALQRQAEEMDLEKALAFDPLQRKIDQLANGLNELPFGEIVAGIQKNQAAVRQLQTAYDAANVAVARQQVIVDAAEKSRAALSLRYDMERRKLEDLQDAYQAYADTVREAEQALSDLGSAGDLSPGAKNFLAAAGGNYPDVAGTGSQLGREFPGVEDQSKLIDEYTKGIAQQTADMFGRFDMFAPIRNGWKNSMDWIKRNVGPVTAGITDWFKTSAGGVSGYFDAFMEGAEPIIHTATDIGKTLWKWLGHIWDLLGPEVKKTLKIFLTFLQDLWKKAGPQLQKLIELFRPLAEALGHLWVALKPLFGLIAVALLALAKIFWSTINGALGPALNAIASIIGNVLQIIINVVKLVVDLINGDWRKAWQDAQQIVAGVFALIGNLLKGAFNIIWGIVKGFVMGIVNFFKWLYDMLVGHSIIPDMIKAIVKWFTSLPTMVLRAIVGLIKDLAKWGWDALNAAWTAMKFVWGKIQTWISGLPGLIGQGLKNLGSILANLAKNAWNNFWQGAKNIIEGKAGFLAWMGGIPARAAGALGKLGGVIANAVKGAWNGAANWINRNVIGNINKVTGVFGATIPSLPQFATGGVIPGPISRKDNVLIAARTGEGILVPEAVRAVGGAAGIDALNKVATGRLGKPAYAQAAGGIQHFVDGGVVGKWLEKGSGFALDNILKPVGGSLRKIMPDGFFEDYMVGIVNKWRSAARSWGTEKDGTWSGPVHAPGNVTGNAAIVRALAGTMYGWAQRQWESLYSLIMGESGFNNLAQNPTSSAYGMFQFLDSTWGTVGGHKTADPRLQSIYGLKYISQVYGNPSNAYFKWLTRSPHWYDNGGMLQPMNGTGTPEPVLTNAQWRAVMGAERAFASMTLDVLKGDGVGILAAANARSRAGSGRASDTLTGGGSSGDTVVHIHGDISLPNITNESSAQEFLDNLGSIARGR
jgi:TP901 family phage tail tape measure protein